MVMKNNVISIEIDHFLFTVKLIFLDSLQFSVSVVITAKDITNARFISNN